MIKLHYTQGPKKVSKGSDKLAPFLRELKQLELPRDVNNPIYFFNNQFRTDEMKEILRRFGAVYHTGSEARFNLAISQLKKYPDFLSPDSDNESQLWVSAVFVDNALILYQSLFDLILQVSWMYYRIYSNFNTSKTNPQKLSISTDTIQAILCRCTWANILKYKNLLDDAYFDTLNSFHDSVLYKRINELANSSKHRQSINYEEVAVDDQLLVKTNTYCSTDTLLSEKLDDVIQSLKDYHNAIYDLIKLMAETHKLK